MDAVARRRDVSGPGIHVLWLSGGCCDGCTIACLGDQSAVPIEDLLTGRVEGLPAVRLVHCVLSPETGDAFVQYYRRAARGELDPFVLVVEGSVSDDATAGEGYWEACGHEAGAPLGTGVWLDRLAPQAAAVLAVGDCAAFGGPHALDPNPTGAHGVTRRLPLDYESRTGLPIVNLPGCAVPAVFMSTLIDVLRYVVGAGPAPELNELGCPRAFYQVYASG